MGKRDEKMQAQMPLMACFRHLVADPKFRNPQLRASGFGLWASGFTPLPLSPCRRNKTKQKQITPGKRKQHTKDKNDPSS
jgi:hypothetical protein